MIVTCQNESLNYARMISCDLYHESIRDYMITLKTMTIVLATSGFESLRVDIFIRDIRGNAVGAAGNEHNNVDGLGNCQENAPLNDWVPCIWLILYYDLMYVPLYQSHEAVLMEGALPFI